MQEVAEEQDAAYIPMPKGRGFTPHFDKTRRKQTSPPRWTMRMVCPSDISLSPGNRAFLLILG